MVSGDTVLVETPGYYNLFGLLKLQGIRMLGVPRTLVQDPAPSARRSANAKKR